MTNHSIWLILGIVAAGLLITYWQKQNAVWGGLTLGVIIGFIIAIIFVFKGSGFDWLIIGKSTIIGTLLGFIAELLGKLSDLVRRKTNN